MKFGEWTVSEDAIEWQGDRMNRFVVSKRDMLETTEAGMYLWILRATEEDWLSEDELYDFNFAFVFAAALSGGDFDYRIFDRTVAHQYTLLDEEESEWPKLGDLTEDDADAEQQRKEGLSERD